MVTDKKTEDFFPKQKAFLNKKQNQIPPFTFLLSHLWKAGGGGRLRRTSKTHLDFSLHIRAVISAKKWVTS